MRIVVALGGNALGKSAVEQKELVIDTAKPIVDLIEDGHEVVIAHGNGPQVGMINNAMDIASQEIPNCAMPFPECGAMSQGYIGYHLQNAIENELASRKIEKEVCTIVTEVIVDKNDKGFENPTKPIGAFYSEEEATELTNSKGFAMVEDAGRGWRRVVASPKPLRIKTEKVIKGLVNNGDVVIACGGGGIPVIEMDNGHLMGVPAVIDKDFASELLAEVLDADYLVVLTAVEKVAINFGKDNQEWLDEINVSRANELIKEKHFAPGSMLPKVEACIKFAESKVGRTALITSLEKAKDGINGLTGTKILK